MPLAPRTDEEIGASSTKLHKNHGDTWTDEEVIEEILKYFSDIPTPAHAITKLTALMQGKEEAIVTYNQKYRTLVESGRQTGRKD